MNDAGEPLEDSWLRLRIRKALAKRKISILALLVWFGMTPHAEAQAVPPNAFLLSTQCKAPDIGSSRARELLAQLRSSPPSTTGLTEYITACEKREKDLRRNEDRNWVAALEAKNRWDCKDAKLLFDPLQKAMTFYKTQAALEMKRLGNCGERIIVASDPNTAMERAENAYKTGDFSVARETSWKFVSLSSSIGQRARTLLQTIEQHEKANSLMTQANSAQIAGRASEACGLLMRVEEENGSLSGLDLRSVRSKLADCRSSRQASALPAAEKRRQFEKYIEAGRGYLDQGNLELATDSVQAAESLFPNEKALEELKRATTAAKEFRNALERSIAQIYQSKNLDAMVGLRDLLATNPPSQALAAKAHFYMGVAMAKQYYVFDDLMLLDKAKLEFKISMDGYPSPDFENVQPEIKELYGQAVRSPGAGVL